MKNYSLPLLVLLAVASAAPAFGKALDEGISMYNSRQYSAAIPKLQQAVSANSNDGKAHYYMALSYQAMGRRADAEREYRWNYENGTDKDLKYKSWQGLVALSRQRSSGRSSASASAPVAAMPQGNVKMLAAGGSPYASKVEKGTAPVVETGFVRGCFKH